MVEVFCSKCDEIEATIFTEREIIQKKHWAKKQKKKYMMELRAELYDKHDHCSRCGLLIGEKHLAYFDGKYCQFCKTEIKRDKMM